MAVSECPMKKFPRLSVPLVVIACDCFRGAMARLDWMVETLLAR